MSDWRPTAGLSSARSETPCVQIWNSNWGLMAGFPDTVTTKLRNKYAAVSRNWQRAFRQLHSQLEANQDHDQQSIFSGVSNIIPDHPRFRTISINPKDKQLNWVGPLVPHPTHWEPTGSAKPNTCASALIAFGGLPHVQDRVGLRAFQLSALHPGGVLRGRRQGGGIPVLLRYILREIPGAGPHLSSPQQ